MNETWRYDEVERPAGFPWPPPEGAPALAAAGETWKGASLESRRFFASLPRDHGTGAAVLYYLIIGVLVAGASLFWDMLTGSFGAGQQVVVVDGPQIGPVIGFLFSPFLLLLGLGLSAGVTHLMLLLLRGAHHGFDTTVRVFCYAYSPMIFGVVPFLGTLLGLVWMLVVAVVGLSAAQETDGWKAALAILLPFLVLMGFVAIAVLAFLAAGAAVLP